jgi:agmatine/peptidylarginine deiminase
MLTWPHAATDWADDLDQVLAVFSAIGAAISHRETLLSVCANPDAVRAARTLLRQAGADPGNCVFGIAASDDSWARDHGPITTLSDDTPTVHDFTFNAWGGKFSASRDNAITSTLRQAGCFGGAAFETHPMVLEGGALETDGHGTLLATRHSVIDEARNPGMGQHDIEKQLSDWLGFDRFLWLDHGALTGDDTDGHIDTLARFADPQTILYAAAPPDDADHDGLRDMRRQLQGFRTRDGAPYRLLQLPFPGLHHDHDGRRLPAGYANFLLINHAVLMPTYGVAADRAAGEVLQQAFPDREILPVDCRPIIRQNGSLHCLTMQFPAQVRLQNTYTS